MHINDTFDIHNQGRRIMDACFFDGEEDEFIVQFFDLGGSILRCVYNRRDTTTKKEFVPVRDWQFGELMKLA